MTALPNLSTWHPVPVGATIPKDTPYAYAYEKDAAIRWGHPFDFVRVTVALEGHFQDLTVPANDYTYYTEHPVTIPLPRAEGATILASLNSDCPPSIVLERHGERWITPCDAIWYDYQIAAWAPITIGNVVK